MSRVYDRWEKLVGAVVKREELRRLAYCESISSSSSISADINMPFSSNSDVAAEDFTMEIVSRTSAPDASRSAVISKGQSFSLERMRGEKSYMVCARELKIKWGDTPRYWEWTYRADSRFSEVAQLRSVCWLDIRGQIEMQILSPKSAYGAYLVFKLSKINQGLGIAKAVVRLMNNETKRDAEKRAAVVHLQWADAIGNQPEQTGRLPVRRSDGWMEIELGSFYNEEGVNGKVEARLIEIWNLHEKSGLIVEGIEFRLKSFSLERMGERKSYMVCARELWITWGDTPQYWEWTSHADSRFSEVAQLRSVYWLDIRAKIKTEMLSSNSTYGAYLVFKLSEIYHGLGSLNAVVRLVNDETKRDAEKRAAIVHLQPEDATGNQQEQTGRLPVRRGDGWMEIELGSFYNEEGDNGKVEARLIEIWHLHEKSGLVVEGIEFRPKV